MATMTNADYTWIREWLVSNPTIKNELKAWGLPKATWKSAFQTVETYMVNGFSTQPATSIRDAIESITGATTPLRAQHIFVIWVSWRLHLYGVSGG